MTDTEILDELTAMFPKAVIHHDAFGWQILDGTHGYASRYGVPFREAAIKAIEEKRKTGPSR
jgi:hypothetical protein